MVFFSLKLFISLTTLSKFRLCFFQNSVLTDVGFGDTVTVPVQYIWMLVLDLNFPPQAVIALPAGALG